MPNWFTELKFRLLRLWKPENQRTMTHTKYVELEGTVKTSLALDPWAQQFITWIEARDEVYEGKIRASTNAGRTSIIVIDETRKRNPCGFWG